MTAMNNAQAMRGRMSAPNNRMRQTPPCYCPMPQGYPKPVACGLSALPLAMAYVPMQTWCTPYTPDKALCRGTLFPQLDLPLGGMR